MALELNNIRYRRLDKKIMSTAETQQALAFAAMCVDLTSSSSIGGPAEPLNDLARKEVPLC